LLYILEKKPLKSLDFSRTFSILDSDISNNIKQNKTKQKKMSSTTTTKNNNALMAMLNQYENNSKPMGKPAEEKFNVNNYFGTFLEQNEKSATKMVRILPTPDGSSPFVEVWGHKATVDGKKSTFACLKHEKGLDCPFCEAREALLATGSDADKTLAKNYSARKMYIVKVIDRDHEDHGVKFWRFNDDYTKKGVYDLIGGIIKTIKKDISDAETGRDLSIIIGRNQTGIPIVTSISHLDPTPLSEDASLVEKWTSDARTWENVYSVKPYEYLEIIVKGGTPVWSKELKKIVDKNSLTAKVETTPLDAELTLGVANVKSNVTAATSTPQATPTITESEVSENDGDDLPF